MNTSNWIWCLSLVSQLWCCHSPTYSEKDEVAPLLGEFNTTMERTEIKLSDYFSDVVLIPLELNERCFINSVDQVKYLADYGIMFILDKNYGRILLFSTEGDFIRQVGTIGRGPGEYASLREIDVNESKKELYGLDAELRKILVFDFEGNFKREFKYSPKKRVESFHHFNDDFVLQIDPNPGEREDVLIFIDSVGQVKEKWLPGQAISMATSAHTNSSFFTYGRDIRFMPLYSEKIYNISDSGMETFVKIRGQNEMDLHKLEQLHYETGLSGGQMNENGFPLYVDYDGVWGVHNYFETENLISFTHNLFEQVVYDKQQDEFSRCLHGFQDDLFPIPPISLTYIFDSGEDYIVTFLEFEPLVIKLIKDNQDKTSRDWFPSNEAFERFNEIDIGSNPMIVIYKE